MQIHGFGQIHQAHSVRPTQKFEAAAEASRTSSQFGPDEVDFSPEARQLSEAASTQGSRATRLAEIKAQIQAGTYETPEKLEVALSRMLGGFE